MKVIFLDVDGVLNYFSATNMERSPCGALGINDQLVEKLATIVNATKATIILSSTWKGEWSRIPEFILPSGKYLNNKLEKYGLKISGRTYDDYDRFNLRGSGINNFLLSHDVESWVVIDDFVFSDFDENIMNHLVLTSGSTGITDCNVNRAIKILCEQENGYGNSKD